MYGSPRLLSIALALVTLAGVPACEGDAGTSGGPDGGGGNGDGAYSGDAAPEPSLSVMGSVVDFTTGAPIAGSATVTTEGLNANPPPTISTSGASFTITGVPGFSVFFLLTGAPPTYRSTYNTATTVEAVNVTGVVAEALSETAIADLEAAFGVTPAAGTGILIARLVDDLGAPLAGFDATTLALTGGGAVQGPFYLDPAKAPSAGLAATSASGYVVWFDVPAGLTTLEPAIGETIAVEAAASPVAANVVTLAVAKVADAAPPLPTGVSFSGDIVTLFERRGCAACHSGNGPGRDRGNLTLDGGTPKIYEEVRNELSPIEGISRVNLLDPPASMILRLPGLPADRHPNVTFASDSDPDYLLLLVWIQEGALNN